MAARGFVAPERSGCLGARAVSVLHDWDSCYVGMVAVIAPHSSLPPARPEARPVAWLLHLAAVPQRGKQGRSARLVYLVNEADDVMAQHLEQQLVALRHGRLAADDVAKLALHRGERRFDV